MYTIRDLLPLQKRSAIGVLKLIFKLFISSCLCASPKRKFTQKPHSLVKEHLMDALYPGFQSQASLRILSWTFHCPEPSLSLYYMEGVEKPEFEIPSQPFLVLTLWFSPLRSPSNSPYIQFDTGVCLGVAKQVFCQENPILRETGDHPLHSNWCFNSELICQCTSLYQMRGFSYLLKGQNFSRIAKKSKSQQLQTLLHFILPSLADELLSLLGQQTFLLAWRSSSVLPSHSYQDCGTIARRSGISQFPFL